MAKNALSSVLRRYVWSSEAWLSKLVVNVVSELQAKNNSCGIARFLQVT